MLANRRCSIQSISILGSGWLGLPLAEQLQQQNYPIKLATRSHGKAIQLSEAGFDSYLIDIEDPVVDLSQFLLCDVLIINITCKNLAAYQSLVQQIAISPVKHVLFISSTSVYRNLQRIVTEDEGAENPESLLYQIEQLFRQSEAFSSTILRLSGLIGPGRHPGLFFRNGKTISQKDAPVNLIHLDDCIAIITAIIKQNCWGQTFNACADTHPSKLLFYTHTALMAGRPAPQFSDVVTPQFKVISSEKLKAVLDYQFIHSDLMKIQF